MDTTYITSGRHRMSNRYKHPRRIHQFLINVFRNKINHFSILDCVSAYLIGVSETTSIVHHYLKASLSAARTLTVLTKILFFRNCHFIILQRVYLGQLSSYTIVHYCGPGYFLFDLICCLYNLFYCIIYVS